MSGPTSRAVMRQRRRTRICALVEAPFVLVLVTLLIWCALIAFYLMRGWHRLRRGHVRRQAMLAAASARTQALASTGDQDRAATEFYRAYADFMSERGL